MSPTLRHQLIILTSTVLVALGRSELCYYPDGHTTSPDIPCNQSAVDAGGHTPCCNNYNMCLDNGLCMGNGIVSRGSCTDPNWGDACPQWCKDENPSGGMPFTPCDAVDFTFACNVNETACRDANPPFYVPKGSGIILRGDQVAPLEANSASVAILLEPTTTLFPVKGSSDKTRVTVTATASLVSGGAFTAADVAGAAVGVGAPLIVALVCMGLIIIRQRRNLREARHAVVEREKMDRDAYMRYQPSLIHPNPTFTASPVSGRPIVHQQYGRFGELDTNHINEMSNDGVLSEMDALSSNGGSKPSENSGSR